MANEISTQLTKLNVSYILKNYLNRELWGKKWTIFENRTYRAELYIGSIEVIANQVSVVLTLTSKDSYKSLYKKWSVAKELESWRGNERFEWIRIPLEHPEYTNEVFINAIMGKVREMFWRNEKDIRELFYDYAELEKIEETNTSKLRDQAQELWDNNNEEIGQWVDEETFIENYVAKRRKSFFKEKEQLKEEAKNTICLRDIVMFYYYMGKYEEAIELLNSNKRNAKIRLTEEQLEEMAIEFNERTEDLE